MKKSEYPHLAKLIEEAKTQKNDIPAPRVKIPPTPSNNLKSNKTSTLKGRKTTYTTKSAARNTYYAGKPSQAIKNGRLDAISSRMVEYDMNSITNLTSTTSIPSDIKLLPPDLARQQLAAHKLKKTNLLKLRKQQRKLIKQVNRPASEHVIKNTAAFIEKREKELGNLFRQEMELIKKPVGAVAGPGKDKQSKDASKAKANNAKAYQSLLQKSQQSIGGVSSATSGPHVMALPSIALSQQTLEDDVKRNKKQLDLYHGMVDPTKLKKFNKLPVRVPKLALYKYLYNWDVSSNARRDSMILQFIETYTSIDPLDFDWTLSRGGSLIFTRFVVSMQLAYERKKPIWHYFQALGLFIKSLQGERFTNEFALMGGFTTAFSSLKIDEMKIRDKANVLYFLYRVIEVPNGTKVKNFICRESTYLDAVVDCLTMCNNIGVIHFAQQFLETMTIGTKIENLGIVANYVISLLPCDFNPRVQIMACQILTLVIHQKGDIASSCYDYVVDVLKTDYDPILVPVGELCIAIMSTPTADDLLTRLIAVVEPGNLSEELATMAEPEVPGVVDETEEYVSSGVVLPDALELIQDAGSDEFDDEKDNSDMTLGTEMFAVTGTVGSYFERPPPDISTSQDVGGGKASVAPSAQGGGRVAAALNADMFFRQQLGSIFVLGFMLKNHVDFAEWMIPKGIIGSLLAAIGSSSYVQVQLTAVRLLLLLHDLTADTGVALQHLLPKKLVVVILEKAEGSLEYITAVHCTILRRLGRLVHKYWRQWFNTVVLPPSKMSLLETSAKSTSISSSSEDAEGGDNSNNPPVTESNATLNEVRTSPISPSFKEIPIETVLVEIKNYTTTLDTLIGDSLDNVITTMDLIRPDAEFFGPQSNEVPLEHQNLVAARLIGKSEDQLTIGEIEILLKDNLEPFRKYLNKSEVTERKDEFEKYYAAQFGAESDYEMGGMEMAALQEAEKALGKLKVGGGGGGEHEGKGHSEDVGDVDSSSDTSSDYGSMHSSLGGPPSISGSIIDEPGGRSLVEPDDDSKPL